ncbi:MAG: extracellular solute-binding protein [Treponema sp.]|nr:extracellular solute-binding protein [Treponema sp.]
MRKLLLVSLAICLIQGAIFASGNRQSSSDQTAQGGAKKTIKFYGWIREYPHSEIMINKLKELTADKYVIETLPVDWNNLATVIRTGIASGEPSDIYQYWSQTMRPFVDSNMALDLTPYLEANGAAWKNVYVQAALDTGKFDGKYYNTPIQSNYPLMFGNKKLIDDLGLTIPDNWTWDQFLDFCAKAKAKGVYPLVNSTDNGRANWFIRNAMLSLAVSDNKQDALAVGTIRTTDPLFAKSFAAIKDLYTKDYMYPGAGSVTITVDEARAGFYQGKLLLNPDNAAQATGIIGDAPFEVTVIPWPRLGTKNAVQGGFDGLFIPANVKDKEAAVEILRIYTSTPAIQEIAVNMGAAIPFTNVTVTDPIVKKVIDYSSAVSPFELYNLNAKVLDYFNNSLIPELVLGGGVDPALGALEKLY